MPNDLYKQACRILYFLCDTSSLQRPKPGMSNSHEGCRLCRWWRSYRLCPALVGPISGPYTWQAEKTCAGRRQCCTPVIQPAKAGICTCINGWLSAQSSVDMKGEKHLNTGRLQWEIAGFLLLCRVVQPIGPSRHHCRH